MIEPDLVLKSKLFIKGPDRYLFKVVIFRTDQDSIPRVILPV